MRLLQPLPSSLGVALHPHVNGDVISIALVDAATGTRHLVVIDPATAHQLGADLTEATTSPAVQAQADAIRGSRGHLDGNTGPS
ncbi:hypothetical protein ACXPWS_04565 [Mycobacterium sp. BMJ-28]